MPIIVADHLSKSYRTADKQPGIGGTLRHFVQRRYRQIAAVSDVSFTIEPGEIVGFLGANGAGKTTALKMLTGLIRPSGGQATVAGFRPFSRQPAFLRLITLVMGQKQQLIWDLPVLDSLRVNAAIYDVSPADYRQRLDELSQMLGLTTQLTQPVRKLSLGERMKAELLAALMHRPQVLFLDEPTLGLDVNAQASVREFLLEYNRRYSATILLTSHYMADIVALCKRVLLIDKGKLIYDGGLDAMIERVAPYRAVKLDLSRPYAAADLSPYGEVEFTQGREARLLVRREDLTRILPRLLGELAVTDLTVTDPPIEEIIGRIFTQGTNPSSSSGN